MNQYIIGEEDVTWLKEELLKRNSPYHESFINRICSHLYDPQAEREKMLEALKKDLQTRFISSGNQWSRGRNSGLNECYNIIDELSHQIKDGE